MFGESLHLSYKENKSELGFHTRTLNIVVAMNSESLCKYIWQDQENVEIFAYSNPMLGSYYSGKICKWIEVFHALLFIFIR